MNNNENLVQQLTDAVMDTNELAARLDFIAKTACLLPSSLETIREAADALRATLPATDGEADAFDSDLFERAYAKGYRAALGAAAAECRRAGTALDNGDNEYTRYPEAIKLAVSIQALRVPGAHGSDAHPAQPVSAWVPEWQPIETAPEFAPDDSGPVLMFEPHSQGGFCFVGVRYNGEFINNLDMRAPRPTHWMPLPAAPTAASNEGEEA